jgi:hypothetical protein
MKFINFKHIDFKHIDLQLTLLPCIFICSLLASQQVLAAEQDFVLNAPDSKEVVAQGNYEELPDSIAKIDITMLDHRFSGTGVISKSFAKPAKGLRADRAMMATKHNKRVSAELVAQDGAKLACELNIVHGDIWGQCVNPSNQQIFIVKTSMEESK